MKLLRLITASSLFIAHLAMASTPVETKLFLMTKSYNPQNIMVINASLDEDCKFVSSNDQYLSFYWLMDGKTRKPVNSLIIDNIYERFQFNGVNDNATSFSSTLGDLKELKHDLNDPSITVTSMRSGDTCKVRSVLQLGPKDNNRKLSLEKIYCDVSKNIVGIPNGCKYLELKGTDVETGDSLTARYNKK